MQFIAEYVRAIRIPPLPKKDAYIPGSLMVWGPVPVLQPYSLNHRINFHTKGNISTCIRIY